MSLAFVGRVYSSIKGFYNEINSATLTGAIDVIIVKQEDGSYLSSPFHVRFGKLGVLRSREKVVDIEINGQPVDLHMKLGEAGEAFFVQEVLEEEEALIPNYLATSPLPSSVELMKKGIKELKAQCLLQEQHLHSQQTHSLEEASQLQSFPLNIPSKDAKSDSSYEEDKQRGKPRRKVLKKKKQKYGSGRPSPRSQSMPEGLLGVEEHIFEMEVSESTEDEEIAAYSAGASRSPSLDTALKRSEGTLVSVDLMKELDICLQERKNSSLEAFLTPFSDPEISPPQSPLPTRPPSPKSDTELDRKHAEESQQSLLPDANATWDWGEFPKQTPLSSPDKEPSRENIESMLERQESEKVTSGGILSLWSKQKPKKEARKDIEEKGMYLDDLASLEDPELARLYLGSPRFVSIRDREDDSESGRGASLPQSPHSVDGAIGGAVSFLESEVRHLGVVSLSLCGGLSDPDGITLDKFMKKVITYDDLAEQPALIHNPDLVVKIRDQYYNWATAAPMVLSEMAFNKQLPEAVVSILTREHMPKKMLKKKTSGLSWFSWRRSYATQADGAPGEGVGIINTASQSTPSLSVSPGTMVTSDNEGISSKMSESSMSPIVSPATSPPASIHSTPKKTQPISSVKEELEPLPSIEMSSLEIETTPLPKVSAVPTTEVDIRPEMSVQADSDLKIDIPKTEEKYYKTLRLTSEQIAKLNLREGRNEITFSVTTQYQGTSRCISHIYLWNYDDKIVISDIDGTITKSDVLGQILPIIGRDWSQSGVAQLFTRLSNNGYKLIYLSARAIGQSRITKDLLKSIKQGDRVLPDGPLLLNPTSLLSAFHREVIVKNPEEFKISCLRDIADLFPCSPFYAGFGNKINDVIAYRALNIPGFRIFTINPQGQLRHDLSHTFISSYSKMSDIADHFFPPVNSTNKSMSNEYSNVNYWRNPMPPIDQLDLDLLSVIEEKPVTKPVTALEHVSSAPTLTTPATTTATTDSTATEDKKKSKS